MASLSQSRLGRSTLKAATILWVLAAPFRLPACAGIEILNDFEEGGCGEIAPWQRTPAGLPFQALASSTGANYLAKNQNWYGWVTWTASTDELKLLVGDFKDQWGGNWTIPAGDATYGRDALRLD